MVCDINEQRRAEFKRDVSAAYPECTLVLECDVTDDSQIDEMFDAAFKMFGKIDYVVNNAGMMDRFDPVGDMEREAWDRVMALNLTAPAMVTRRAVRDMMRNDIKGSIVNIASIAGTRGFTNGIYIHHHHHHHFLFLFVIFKHKQFLCFPFLPFCPKPKESSRIFSPHLLILIRRKI